MLFADPKRLRWNWDYIVYFLRNTRFLHGTTILSELSNSHYMNYFLSVSFTISSSTEAPEKPISSHRFLPNQNLIGINLIGETKSPTREAGKCRIKF